MFCFVKIYFVALFAVMFSANVYSSTMSPPPPQGPPQPSTNTNGGLAVVFLRDLIQRSGDEAILKHNEENDHKLSWHSGSKPLECGDCMSSPFMTTSKSLYQPNYRVARVRTNLKFDLDIDNSPFSRQIITPIEVTVSCNEWQSGKGRIKLLVRTDTPYIAGGSTLESIIDFFLPWGLSSHIDNEIRKRLPGGSSSMFQEQKCISLGVFTDAQSSQFESFTWDRPAPVSVLDTMPVTVDQHTPKVKLTINAIRRVQTPVSNSHDFTTPVSFEIYVNGKFLPATELTNLIIPETGTVIIEDTKINFPTNSLNSLQLIVRDSVSGSAWVQFNAAQNFGKGTHKLKTHRHIYLNLPAPNGSPTPLKPLPTDVREFELEFTINKIQQVIELSNG